MITVVRSVEARDGKFRQALEGALQTASLINEKYDKETRVMGNVAGKSSQLHWVTEFESLAEFEEWVAKVSQDEKLAEMVAEHFEQGLFVEGSFTDNIYRTLS